MHHKMPYEKAAIRKAQNKKIDVCKLLPAVETIVLHFKLQLFWNDGDT